MNTCQKPTSSGGRATMITDWFGWKTIALGSDCVLCCCCRPTLQHTTHHSALIYPPWSALHCCDSLVRFSPPQVSISSLLSLLWTDYRGRAQLKFCIKTDTKCQNIISCSLQSNKETTIMKVSSSDVTQWRYTLHSYNGTEKSGFSSQCQE